MSTSKASTFAFPSAHIVEADGVPVETPILLPPASARPRRAQREIGSTRRWLILPRLRIGLILGAIFLFATLTAAVFPRLLTSIDPLETNARDAFQAPTAAHPLGTDENGRDVYSRIIYGARTSVIMGVSATAIGLTFGITIGLIAGLGSKFTDSLMMRGVDVLLAFPEILMALLILTFLGPGLIKGLIAIGIASIPQYARLARAQAQLVRNSQYVEAAIALGLRRSVIVVRHILPNAIKPVLVLALISIGGKISAGAALSFLGLGTPPPTPEWGAMLSVGREYLANAWWLTVFPGLALTFTVLSVSGVGRGLLRRREGKAA